MNQYRCHLHYILWTKQHLKTHVATAAKWKCVFKSSSSSNRFDARQATFFFYSRSARVEEGVLYYYSRVTSCLRVRICIFDSSEKTGEEQPMRRSAQRTISHGVGLVRQAFSHIFSRSLLWLASHVRPGREAVGRRRAAWCDATGMPPRVRRIRWQDMRYYLPSGRPCRPVDMRAL